MNRHRALACMLLSTVLLAAGGGLSGASADDLAKEVTRREADLAKAKQVYDDAVGEADSRAVKAYVRIAKGAGKDADTAKAAWTEVLRLDRKQADALAWFTKQGTLEAVLGELDHPTDLLGNPVGGAGGARPGKCVLVIGTGGSLVPSGVRTLTEAIMARTTELVVGAVTGDGVLFEEGGSINGQAIGIVGNELHYVVRANGVAATIKAPFVRTVPWTQVVVQFDGGALRVWLNGKLAGKGDAGFASIPGHGGGGVGNGDGSNPGGWAENCQFLLASLRMSNRARYSDQVHPSGTMEADADTVLALTPEAIAAELAALAPAGRKASDTIMLQRVERMPPGNITWTVGGMVGVR